MLIVGVNAKLTRRPHANRWANTWWVHLSPIISQLYDAGGYNMLVDTVVATGLTPGGGLAEARVTCRYTPAERDFRSARLWIADDSLRGTLRLPFQPLLEDWPDVIEGFLTAQDSSPASPWGPAKCVDPEVRTSLLPPYLVWKGTR